MRLSGSAESVVDATFMSAKAPDAVLAARRGRALFRQAEEPPPAGNPPPLTGPKRANGICALTGHG